MDATAASTIIMVSSQYLLIISLLILCLLTAATSAASSCPERCGEVDIKYPFGIGPGCFFPGFEVTCMNQSVPFLSDSPYHQLVEIILSNGEVRVDSTPYFSYSTCLATSQFGPTKQITLLHDNPFTFSLDANTLVVVGCNVGAAISDTKDFKEFSGCKSLCHSLESMYNNGSCIGNGCCEVPIPRAKKSLSLFAYVGDEEGIKTQRNINSCCKGYVVEEGSYEFDRLDVWRENLSGKLTTKLEWAIGQGRNACYAEKTICGSNSYCEESRRRDGYLCNCKPLMCEEQCFSILLFIFLVLLVLFFDSTCCKAFIDSGSS